MRIYLSRVTTVILILLCLGILVSADTIKLKNGSIIKGKVVSFNQGEFTLILDFGSSSRKSTSRMIIVAEDIESIEFDAADAGYASPRTEIPRESSPTSQSSSPEKETSIQSANLESETAMPASESGLSASTPILSEKEVRIAAAADWTSTEVRVQKGQRITISASGEIDLGEGQSSGPGGISRADSRKLMANRPTGALIAVIGDDNDDFIFVGRSAEFTAAHTGILFLSVNEGELKNNSGSFIARVKVMEAK